MVHSKSFVSTATLALSAAKSRSKHLANQPELEEDDESEADEEENLVTRYTKLLEGNAWIPVGKYFSEVDGRVFTIGMDNDTSRTPHLRSSHRPKATQEPQTIPNTQNHSTG